MRRFALRAAAVCGLILGLAGCLGGQMTLLDQQKATLQFCNTYVGTMQQMIVYRSLSLLTAKEIDAVNSMATIVGPHCSQPIPPPPTQALIAALDSIVLMQLQKAQGR